MTHPDTPDIIVIGGGIAGVSAAAELAAFARVVVLEAEPQIGYHATGRSAATFIINYGNAVLRKLNAAAESFMLEPDGVSDHALLSPRGALIVARADEVPALEASLAGASGMERISVDEAVRLFPILRPEGLAAAAHETTARDIDVDRMLQGYARLLRDRGGRIRPDARVEALRRDGGHWQVTAGGESLTAPVVINAAGAWADGVAKMAGVRPCAVQPMRRSAALIPVPAGQDASGWPLVLSASEAWYAKPDAGRLLVSPADEDPVEAQDAWPDDMVLAEGLHRFEQAVTLPVTRVEHRWAGLRSFAPDRTPVVGFAPDAPGFFWLAGQGGYGVQTAPTLSRLTAALVDGATPALDQATLGALSPERFQ